MKFGNKSSALTEQKGARWLNAPTSAPNSLTKTTPLNRAGRPSLTAWQWQASCRNLWTIRPPSPPRSCTTRSRIQPHHTLQDTSLTLAQLKQEFGDDVADLVNGMTRLSYFDNITSEELNKKGEALRQMFVTMVEDIRVVFIKLADRLHTMRTLETLPEEQRRHVARETMEVFAPLANRLGAWKMKWELEDYSFRYTHPEEYKRIADLINQKQIERSKQIDRVIKRLEARLKAEEIQAEISGRPKHIYSIYRKMQRKGIPFDQVFDVRGVRVIVANEMQCYQVLGIVHGMWPPIHGEFDDYIAVPKDNNYRSLHTAVIDDDGTPLEIQIRTPDMHKEAEYGMAAHWKYKEGGPEDPEYENKIAWLRSLLEWRHDVTNRSQMLAAFKSDVFQDRVYVFSPKGKLIDLPAGSTPIDFAYHIHTDIGHRCRGARVKGKLVSLDYQLQTGDQVQILTIKRGGPSRDWLNPSLGYVKTERARAKIRQWFRQQDREQNIAAGRALLEKEIRHLGVSPRYEELAKSFHYPSVESFLAAIGQTEISPQQIAARINELEQSRRPPEQSGAPLIPPTPPIPTGELSILGVSGLLSKTARCCNPLPGDAIIGYVTRGRGVSIHKQECPNILRTQERERLIDVKWGTAEQTYPVVIKITAYDRGGLLRDIGAVIADQKISMSSVSSSTEKNLTTIYATLQVSSIAQLSRVLTRLEQVRNVIEARRHVD